MRRLFLLLGSGLLTACSLSGLVFDLGGSGGAGGISTGSSPASSSSTGGSASSTTTSTSSDTSSSSMPACMSNSSSSAGSGVEIDCTNGLDDDGDGKADCDDPDCMSAGYACRDVPAGWMGPVAFFEGTAQDNPCCPSDYPTLGPVGGTAPMAQNFTCSACSCSASVKCTPSALVSHAVAGCADVGTSIMQDTLCHPLTGSYVSAAPPTVTVNPCVPSGGNPITKPPPAWTTADRLCLGQTKGMGCTGTQVCARPGSGVFGGALCIYTAGAQMPCPAGFPTQHSFFTAFTDSRACTGCSCGSAGPPSCTVTSSVYSSNMCNGANKLIVNAPNNGTCVAAPGASSFNTTVNAGSVTCPAMGGVATGMVTGDTASEVTVCCTP